MTILCKGTTQTTSIEATSTQPLVAHAKGSRRVLHTFWDQYEVTVQGHLRMWNEAFNFISLFYLYEMRMWKCWISTWYSTITSDEKVLGATVWKHQGYPSLGTTVPGDCVCQGSLGSVKATLITQPHYPSCPGMDETRSTKSSHRLNIISIGCGSNSRCCFLLLRLYMPWDSNTWSIWVSCQSTYF